MDLMLLTFALVLRHTPWQDQFAVDFRSSLFWYKLSSFSSECCSSSTSRVVVICGIDYSFFQRTVQPTNLLQAYAPEQGTLFPEQGSLASGK